MKESKLFTPYQMGPVTLRNRVIRSAAFESMGKDFAPTQDLKDYHAAKIAERAAAEKRAPSFQMVIDDVYAIGKGRLVGRPR